MSDRFDELAREWLQSRREAVIERDLRGLSSELSSLLRRVAEEAQQQKPHDGPESCPIWYDECHCVDAWNTWREMAKKAESDLAASRERERRLREAILGLRYKPDPTEISAPDRFCDHAAEPCEKCERLRAALAETESESVPLRGFTTVSHWGGYKP